MLIQEALNLLTPDLIALGWVEFFGGVTQKVTQAMPNSTDGVVYKSFPISCSVTTAQCNNNQRYQQLMPDSSKKSVLYWEITQGLSDVGIFRDNQQIRILRGKARLVGWLNTQKLGVNYCNAAAYAQRSILPILYKKFTNGGGNALLEKASIDFFFSQEEKKDKDIFSQYDYGKDVDAFLLYPYDTFAMNVDITMRIPLCDYTFATSTPITCIDFSTL